MTKGVVIVLGMHRSGTSALTRGLTCLGIGLGDDLKPAVAGDNAKGFFEDWELSRINDELLNLQGAQWDSLCIRDGWAADRAKALKLRASLAIEERFGSYQYFAFKDPRTCRTLPFWKDLFARHELQTFYVIAFRNPMSVASSLETRDNFPRIRSYYLWLLHTLNAVLHTKESQRVFVEYDDLLQEPEAALRSIRDLVSDPAIAILPDELEAYKQEFIDQQARHHKHEPFHLALDETCPSLVRETYRQLQLAKTGNFDADQWQVLFNALDNLAAFSELPDDLDQRAKQAIDQLNKVTDERNVRETRINSLSQDLIERDALIASNTAAISQRDARISSLSHDLGERDRNIAILTDTIGDRDAKIDHLSKDLIERDAHIDSLSQAMTERTARINSLSQDLIERDAHIDSLSQAMAETTDRVNSLSQDLIERDAHIDSLSQAMTERTAQINSLSQDLIEGNAQIDYLSQAATEREKVIANLRQGMAETREGFAECLRDAEERVALLEMQLTREQASLQNLHRQLYDIHQSLSWRAWSFFSAVNRNIFGQRSRVPSPIAQINQVPPHTKSTTLIARAPTPRREPQDVSVAYFTICSRNFLAFARTLHASLAEQYGQVQFYVALCDAPEAPFDATEHPFQFVYLDDLDLPQWREMSQRYNITEFNTAIKPFVIRHLMNKGAGDYIVYLDPDIIVKSRFAELETAFAAGVPAVLTPHVTGPAENVEVSDVKMLVYGIYNLGFAAFRNTPDVQSIVNWWGRRLINECVIKLEEGLFVDQKWADLFPAFLDGLLVLRHPGYNVAYWNVAQRTVTRTIQGEYLVNGEPLRFAHFSGSNLDDAEVYSRHSGQFNTKNIGALAQLLDEYREKVFANGHTRFRKIPYAFNWNGAAGVNLHTPKELDRASANTEVLPPPNIDTPTLPHTNLPASLKSLSRRLLYLDWAIPKPDQDAASVTATILFQIFDSLGYSVTFIPCSLTYEEGYFEELIATNIEVLVYPKIQSVQEWLKENASRYDVCVLARGPVAWPHLETIKKYAPNLKLIFNTVDLHHLREFRQAELSNSDAARKAASTVRDQELELIDKCDLTILLSSDELYTVREMRAEAALTVLPVVFKHIPGPSKGFDHRRDILFIGSFPHQPNIDAVLFFANSIFPLIREKIPDIRFRIVGAHPPEEVQRLTAIEGIDVLGYVRDLDPLFSDIKLTIAPLRYGAGIKGKIATSFCYGVPCVATSIAVEGMGLSSGLNVLVADTPQAFANAVCDAYDDPALWQKLSAEGHSFARNKYSIDVVQDRVRNLLMSVSQGWQAIHNMVELEDWGSYQRHSQRMNNEYTRRVWREQALLPNDKSASFRLSGFCCTCGVQTYFVTTFLYATSTTPDGRPMPNWREQMQCDRCGLVSRVRAALHVLHTFAAPDVDSEIYVTERITNTYSWLAERYPRLTGSEYFGPSHNPGSMVEGVRHEDLMNLSFAPASFDHILCLDKIHLIPNPDKAFEELFRVLKPGGKLIFSVPYSSDSDPDLLRATQQVDGSVNHHLTAEYHGNSIDPDTGARCFRNFDSEGMTTLRRLGFTQVRCIAYWSELQGYLGREQYTFVAVKAKQLEDRPI